MRRLLVPILLLAGLAAFVRPARADEQPAAGGPLTLERVFGGPPVTRAIPAWRWRPGHAELVRTTSRRVVGADGTPASRRLIEAMDPATGTTRVLLDLTDLESLVPGTGRPMRGIGRVGPSDYEWAPSGTALCAVVKGDLVWVDLATNARRRLTRTRSPMADLNVAPDGRHVTFARDNDLWVVPTADGESYPLTSGGRETLLNGTLDWVYPEELGHRTASWFSPDGELVAFLQLDEAEVPRYRVPGVVPLRSEGREMFYPKAGDPNPKARVGIVPVKGGKTTWVDLGDPAPEYVVRVGWRSSRGTPLLHVITLDRAQRHLRCHVALPSGEPATLLFEERDPAWIAPPPAPRVAPEGGGGFLWRREEASTRWYRASTGEDQAVRFEPLTPEGLDAAEVLHHDWTTGRTLYTGIVHGEIVQGVFEGGPGVTKARRAKIAPDPGTWADADVDGTGTYALVSTSSAIEPTVTRLVRVADGAVLREIGDARAPALDTVDLAVPEYGSLPVEGLGRIQWRLWKPARPKRSERYGLIVQVYGGPGSRTVSDTWGRGPLFPTFLTEQGFLVLQVDGRGTGGQGRAFTTCVQGRLGLLELEDVVRAVKEIAKRSYVDPGRVGIWGWSYGGTMACNALTMRSDVFRAGVAVAPVTDWRLYDTIYTERYMGLPAENEDGYKETSSISHAGTMTGNLLLLHGLGDDNVHAQNTLRLVEAFLQAGKPNVDWMLYPRRGHGLGGATLDVFRRLTRHFQTYLK